MVRPRSSRAALPAGFVDGAIDFMTAKYPIDPERVLIHRGRAGKLVPPTPRKQPAKPAKP